MRFDKNNKHLKFIYPLLLLVIFALVYQVIFDTKIDTGGDNAYYYILGQNISKEKSYTNTHHIASEKHYHYPPGYPALIAGIDSFFPNNTTAVKYFTGVLFYLSIILSFFIFYKLTTDYHISFLTCILILFNYHLLGFATVMMSEIPFLFFSLLSIYICLQLDFNKVFYENRKLILAAFLVGFCIYIRSVGIALLLSFLVYLFQKKQIKYAIAFGFVVLLLYMPWIIRNQSSKGNSYIQQLLLKNPYQPEVGFIDLASFMERVLINIERYITKEIPYVLFKPDSVIYTVSNAPLFDWLIGLLTICIIVFGFYKQKHFRHLLLTYLGLFCGMLIIWPEIWYGTRFILPIVPFIIFYFVSGIKILLSWLVFKMSLKTKKIGSTLVTALLMSFWTLGYAKASIVNLNNKANSPYPDSYQNYFSISKWVKENLEDTAIICVRKEALFYLFSDRKVTTFKKTPDLKAQIEYLKEKGTKYVVLDQLGFSSTYRYLYPTIERYPNKFKIIKELQNPNTYLMEFKPDLGYWGEWAEDKRNGYGTYNWEDGQKFEGHWKNDVRHGQGILTFSNGEQLVGHWTNGILNGNVIKKSKEGNIIETSIYENNTKIKVIEASK